MKLIIGLGNPGKIYLDSRHNIGFRVVSAVAKEYGIKLKKDPGAYALTGKGKIEDKEVMLAEPFTFMNLSGVAVRALIKKYKIDLSQVLVILDDLDLELGRIKIRPAGSSAGHRGLASVIEYLSSKNFGRLRIGIGRPPANLEPARYVLSPFRKTEKESAEKIIDKAGNCAISWVTRGISKTMNSFN